MPIKDSVRKNTFDIVDMSLLFICYVYLSELSRRDDLEALGYCLVYLIRGDLPWQGLRGPNMKEKYEVIEKKKMEITLDALCTNMPCKYCHIYFFLIDIHMFC